MIRAGVVFTWSVLFMLAVTHLACVKSEARLAARDEPRTCEELKESLGPAADQKFATEVPRGEALPVWRFRFGNLLVAVPEDDYELLPSVSPGSVDVFLTSPRHRVFLSRMWGPEAANYIESFRKSVLAYQHDRSSLSCKPGTRSATGCSPKR
jgi:hypothetical protein